MKVDRRYTDRKAICYNRQSTLRQVEENKGSTIHQRDQREHATRLGWPPENIIVLDGDLGKSGTNAVRRNDYRRAREMIGAGVIGGMFASDMSRLGRNSLELLSLIDDCRLHHVLIVLNGDVNDPNNPSQRFTQQIMALVSDLENLRRCEMMVTARMAIARSGKAVSAPPIGYVSVGDGRWEMDPDPRVQEGIRAVFREFPRCRSLAKTVRRLNELEIQIWKRHGAHVVPTKPTAFRIARILHNVAYKGWYCYPQRKIDQTAGLTEAGYARMRKATDDESTRTVDHHEPYVTAEEWADNLHALEMNRPTEDRRNLGPGAALLQGLVRCAEHDERAMSTNYTGRLKNTPYHGYQCIGSYLSGGTQCHRVPGGHVDRAVATALLRKLALPELQILHSAWDEARRNAFDEARQRRHDTHRARQRVEDAKARVLAADSSRTLIIQMYESEYEQAELILRRVEQLAHSEPSAIDQFTEETWNHLHALAADLPAIWCAPTTDNRDRKELARTMIDRVLIERVAKSGRRTAQVDVRVLWKDGHEATTLEIKLYGHAHNRIRELAEAGQGAEEITRQLNAEALVTNQGNPWTKDTVAHALRALRNSN